MKTKKQGLRRILNLSQSVILDFLLPSGYYLPENQGGQTYFAPFSVRPEGAPPPAPPKLMPMSGAIQILQEPDLQQKGQSQASLHSVWRTGWQLVARLEYGKVPSLSLGQSNLVNEAKYLLNLGTGFLKQMQRINMQVILNSRFSN